MKRAVDCVIAGGGLLALAPGMAIIALAIKLDSRGGALFAQERIGRYGRTFSLLKFRTMHPAPIVYNDDGSTRVDAADKRVTRVGRVLRGALDELPQLINILRGEMSLVGPRPEMASQRWMYSPGDERKLDMRPGITSLAIVHGRNDIAWRHRVDIDLQYVAQWTLWLDVRILAQTLAMPFGIRICDFSDVLQRVEWQASSH